MSYVGSSNLRVDHYYDYKHLNKKNGVPKFASNIKRRIRVACGIKLRERRSHSRSNNLRRNPSSSRIVNIRSPPHHELSPSKKEEDEIIYGNKKIEETGSSTVINQLSSLTKLLNILVSKSAQQSKVIHSQPVPLQTFPSYDPVACQNQVA